MSGTRALGRTSSKGVISATGMLQIASGVALDTTLRAVTDQAGNASPLFLSTTQVNIGGGTSLGRLVVRGDGTNPVARFEGSTGVNIVSVRQSDFSLIFGAGVADTFAQIGLQNLSSATTMNNSGNGQMLAYRANFNRDWPSFMHSFFGSNHDYSAATLSNNPAGISAFNGVFGISTAAASTFDYRMLSVNYTINNTAVSNRTATGIFLNATQTNLNSMTHNVMDLQVNSSSVFRVNNSGVLFNPTGSIYTGAQIGRIGYGLVSFNINGVILLSNASENDFNRLQLGGTTNAFPSIKRNGTAIDFRLADDSNYVNINSGSSFVSGTIYQAMGTGSISGVQYAFQTNMNIVPSAGSASFRPHEILYTINASGAQTGTATGILVSAIETNLNGITHNLIDLLVGGSSKFKVTNTGVATFGSSIFSSGNLFMDGNVSAGAGSDVVITNRFRFRSPGTGIVTFLDNAGTDFNRLQFGGTTSLFPALKRNGATLETRLADDSGFCNLNTGILSIQNIVASAAAISSTHKVTISIGGSTYYLLASNV